MPIKRHGKKQSLYPGWRVVFAGWVGEVLSAFPVLGFTFGIFFAQVIATHGWSRDAASAYSLFLLFAGIGLPFWGMFVDRYGARRCITVAVIALSVVMISFKWLSTLAHWYIGYVLMGLASGGISALPYFRVISAWFDRRRGLALGLVMTGGGISAACMPFLVQVLIEHVGWRDAFVLVAGLIVTGTLLIVWLFLVESPKAAGVQPAEWGEDSTSGVAGLVNARPELSPGDALRSADFWLMTVGMSVASLPLLGSLAHLVPILRDWGFSEREAAFGMSALGAGSMMGRVVSGWLLDHFFASYVTTGFFLLAGMGFLLIGVVDHELWVIVLCMFAMGLVLGGEGDILAYMTSRYFGIASFGKIYGYGYTGLILGGAVGPAVLGWALAAGMSPDAMMALCGLTVIAAVVPILRMSDYRKASPVTAASRPASGTDLSLTEKADY